MQGNRAPMSRFILSDDEVLDFDETPFEEFESDQQAVEFVRYWASLASGTESVRRRNNYRVRNRCVYVRLRRQAHSLLRCFEALNDFWEANGRPDKVSRLSA